MVIPQVPAPRQPLQNILWLVGERLGRALITATVLGIVARHLEPAGFGRLNFVITAVTIAAVLASLGLEGLVVNELIRRPGQVGAVLGTAFRLRLMAGVITAGLLGSLALLFEVRDAPLLAVVSLGLLFQPVDVVDLLFQRHLDSRRTVVARFVGISIGATLKLWLVATGAPLQAFAWAQIVDVASIALALAWAGWTSPHQTGRWSWDSEIGHTLWRRGAPLALSGVVVAFAMRLDQLLVRTWLGESQAGIYFAATRLSDIGTFAGAAVIVSLFPALAASHARSPTEYQTRLQAMFDALSALGWIVALGCTLAGPWVIGVLYGPTYAGATTVLAIQGWAALLALSASARWNFIILSAPTIVNLGAALLHMVTLLGLAALLMPRLSTTGAAVSLLAANWVSGFLTTILFPSLRPCATVQIRGLLIPFTPKRWRGLLQQFHT